MKLTFGNKIFDGENKGAVFPLPYKEVEAWSKIMVLGAFLATIINLVIGLYLLAALTSGAMLIYAANLLYVKYVSVPEYGKIFFYLFTIVILNVVWALNFGSQGPMLYCFTVLYSVAFLFLTGKEKIAVLLFLSFDMFTLFVIEFFNLVDLGGYADEESRIIDLYLSLFVYVLVYAGLIRIVKSSYVKEKMKSQEVEQLKQNFLTNLNHEIRTPVNIINGFSQLFEQSTDPEKQKKYAKAISQNAEKLLMLVGNIIELSEIQQGKVNFTYLKVSMSQFLAEEFAFLKTTLGSHNRALVKPVLKLPSEDFEIYLDIKYVKRIIENILINAVQHTNEGEICICLQLKKTVVLTIEDTGVGMEYANQDELSDTFNKSGESTEINAGVGIAISKTLVSLMGGSFELGSKKGVGTVVRIDLPLLKMKPKCN